jgi:predicted component of type VI protein secretion system
MSWLSCGERRLELPEGETVVGSGAMATWRVAGLDLMPRHFIITRRGDDATVRPFGTDDVVALNGEQLGESGRPLADGDRVDAGSARFRYTRSAPEGDAPPERLSPEPAWLVDARERVAYPLAASTGIGRDPSNVVLLHDPTASRFHAEVRREAGGYALHAMGSSGTKRNGERVASPILLRAGDQIELAYVTLAFAAGVLPPGTTVAPPHGSQLEDLAQTRPTLTMERERTSLPDQLAMPRASRPTSAPILPWIVVVLLAIVLGVVLVGR